MLPIVVSYWRGILLIAYTDDFKFPMLFAFDEQCCKLIVLVLLYTYSSTF